MNNKISYFKLKKPNIIRIIMKLYLMINNYKKCSQIYFKHLLLIKRLIKKDINPLSQKILNIIHILQLKIISNQILNKKN